MAVSLLLGKIKSGKQRRPYRLVVAGPAGVGKSTFAAGAPDALFIDTERRTDHLDIKRLEPATWDDALEFLREIYKEAKAGKPPCKTLVIDTLDRLEVLIQQHVCKKNGWEHIAEAKWDGYAAAVEVWRTFITSVEALRDVGISVVMLAHTAIRQYENPAGPNYDQHKIQLAGGPSKLVTAIADAIGFASFEDTARAKFHKRTGEQQSRGKAETTGRRVLYFSHNPAYESKQGLNLPDEVELTWSAIEEFINDK